MTQLALFDQDDLPEWYYAYYREKEGAPEFLIGRFDTYKEAVLKALDRQDPPPIEYPIRLNDRLDILVLKPYGKKPRRRS